jgi:hypothetical protein
MKTCCYIQLQIATDKGQRHFMGAARPWQRWTDDRLKTIDEGLGLPRTPHLMELVPEQRSGAER